MQIKLKAADYQKEKLRDYSKTQKHRNNEVINTIKAKDYLQDKFKFDLKSLVEMHRLLLRHEPAKHGLRDTEIIVGEDASLCNPERIKENLNVLFSWYREHQKKLYPPELAFLFYYKFERIHPFVDGNGRMGRLLMNEFFRRSKYHPIIIWNTRGLAHFSAFKKEAGGTMVPFLRFMNLTVAV